MVIDNEMTKELSDEEVGAWFGSQEETKYVDPKTTNVKRSRALIQFWNELDMATTRAKEGYHMAKKWNDDELKTRYMEEGRPLIKKMMILEKELKTTLESLKGVSFLTEQELSLLPLWMLGSLNIKIKQEGLTDA